MKMIIKPGAQYQVEDRKCFVVQVRGKKLIIENIVGGIQEEIELHQFLQMLADGAIAFPESQEIDVSMNEGEVHLGVTSDLVDILVRNDDVEGVKYVRPCIVCATNKTSRMITDLAIGYKSELFDKKK